MITQYQLKEVLHYNKDTGIFTWKIATNPKMKVGNLAGTINSDGYICIRFKKKAYKAHRLAWFYVYNQWPRNQIDHINGIKDDNRISNLRDITNRENGQNRENHRNGKLVGCYFNKNAQKWIALISIKGKQTHIGVYNTELEAHKAYVSMEWILSEVEKL